MAKDTKKRQKQLQKKNAKRKQKQAALSRQKAALATPSLSRAKAWPLEAAWITADWREYHQLIQTLVIRRGPHGHVALGNVLIDTMCLGVKNAYGRITDEYESEETLDTMRGNQTMVETDVDLIAKIIRDSVAYASEIGFRPNKDLRQAMVVLGDADPDACPIDVPLGGPEGKPHFFAGPNDNVDRIMATLMEKLGPDGFHYTVHMDDPDDALIFGDDTVGFVEPDNMDDGTIVLADEDYKAVN